MSGPGSLKYPWLFSCLFSLRRALGPGDPRPREEALVDPGFPAAPSRTRWGLGPSDFFFFFFFSSPSCQNHRSSAPDLVILRPRGGRGLGFFASLVRTLGAFLLLIFFSLLPEPSVLSGGPRHPEAERGGGGPGSPVHWSPVSWTRDFFFPPKFFVLALLHP